MRLIRSYSNTSLETRPVSITLFTGFLFLCCLSVFRALYRLPLVHLVAVSLDMPTTRESTPAVSTKKSSEEEWDRTDDQLLLEAPWNPPTQPDASNHIKHLRRRRLEEIDPNFLSTPAQIQPTFTWPPTASPLLVDSSPALDGTVSATAETVPAVMISVAGMVIIGALVLYVNDLRDRCRHERLMEETRQRHTKTSQCSISRGGEEWYLNRPRHIQQRHPDEEMGAFPMNPPTYPSKLSAPQLHGDPMEYVEDLSLSPVSTMTAASQPHGVSRGVKRSPSEKELDKSFDIKELSDCYRVTQETDLAALVDLSQVRTSTTGTDSVGLGSLTAASLASIEVNSRALVGSSNGNQTRFMMEENDEENDSGWSDKDSSSSSDVSVGTYLESVNSATSKNHRSVKSVSKRSRTSFLQSTSNSATSSDMSIGTFLRSVCSNTMSKSVAPCAVTVAGRSVTSAPAVMSDQIKVLKPDERDDLFGEKLLEEDGSREGKSLGSAERSSDSRRGETAAITSSELDNEYHQRKQPTVKERIAAAIPIEEGIPRSSSETCATTQTKLQACSDSLIVDDFQSESIADQKNNGEVFTSLHDAHNQTEEVSVVLVDGPEAVNEESLVTAPATEPVTEDDGSAVESVTLPNEVAAESDSALQQADLLVDNSSQVSNGESLALASMSDDESLVQKYVREVAICSAPKVTTPDIGLELEDSASETSYPTVSGASPESPLGGHVFVGDCVLSVNSQDTMGMSATDTMALVEDERPEELSHRCCQKDVHLTLLSSEADGNETASDDSESDTIDTGTPDSAAVL